jgi:hypothetical protein
MAYGAPGPACLEYRSQHRIRGVRWLRKYPALRNTCEPHYIVGANRALLVTSAAAVAAYPSCRSKAVLSPAPTMFCSLAEPESALASMWHPKMLFYWTRSPHAHGVLHTVTRNTAVLCLLPVVLILIHALRAANNLCDNVFGWGGAGAAGIFLSEYVCRRRVPVPSAGRTNAGRSVTFWDENPPDTVLAFRPR